MLIDPPAVLAADIGATSMRAAVIVTTTGRLLARRQIPTEAARGLDEAASRLATLLAAVQWEANVPVGAVGVATAGPVDPSDGTYRHPPNLPGWHDRSMVPALSVALGLPVAVGHDATLAALAETRFGDARGARDLVYLTVSTGIGAGIIAAGRMVTGASGGAGEAGHLIVAPTARSWCGAGCPGCLEGVASGAAIAAEARARVAEGAVTVLTADTTAADVFAAADAGDALAGAIVEAAVGHLGAGIAGLLAVLDPEALVLGGGVVAGLGHRWPALLATVQSRALPRYAERGVPVALTSLGDDASLLGAAVLSRTVQDFGRAQRD
ncbi:MAG: ROK family protein [Dehalococcoidia bacterium]|nr:ROK family protein [Dehalococcoidia bacterium]